MATAQTRPYRHVGVFLPMQNRNDDPDRVAREWPRTNNTHIASKGFLLGSLINTISGTSVTLVQSVQTGELLAHKLVRPSPDGEDFPEYPEPLELRVSTWQDTLPSREFPNDVPHGVLPQDAAFFNQLKFWQHCTPDDDGARPAYSLYFEYCNGGDLRDFIEKYQDLKISVPEHFIWLVAEQLCLAIAWLHFGERPDVRGHQAPANWKMIYHRDSFTNNIFINYPPRRPGRIPAAGVESNAFPQVVLGDFGNSAVDGDDEMKLPLNVLGGEEPEDTELREWEHKYGVDSTLRRLSQAHLPHNEAGPGSVDYWDRRPDNIRMAELNARDGSAPDFSDQLVDLLGNFEYDGMETGVNITDLDDPLGEVMADSRWMVDTLYPAARDRVAAYRNPLNGRPAGYFDGLDVSWTRPDTVMPFMYNTRCAAAAGDADDDEDDEGNHDDQDPSEVARMQKLGALHEWDDVRPSYELRSLEYLRPTGPTIKPLRNQPPGTDDVGDDGG